MAVTECDLETRPRSRAKPKPAKVGKISITFLVTAENELSRPMRSDLVAELLLFLYKKKSRPISPKIIYAVQINVPQLFIMVICG